MALTWIFSEYHTGIKPFQSVSYKRLLNTSVVSGKKWLQSGDNKREQEEKKCLTNDQNHCSQWNNRISV